LFFRKSKNLTDQYQLLVDQRQADIDRLTKSLEEKSVVIERVEKTNQDEVRKKISILIFNKFLRVVYQMNSLLLVLNVKVKDMNKQ
jgi:hypothetical protein